MQELSTYKSITGTEDKTRLSDVYKAGIFILLITSSLSYVFATTSGISAKIINLGFNFITLAFLLVVAGFLNEFPRARLFNPLNYFIFIFVFSFVVSLVRNQVHEWIPSFLRFANYILIFVITYVFCRRGKLTDQFVAIIVNCVLIPAILGGIYEIATGQVQFLNGAYRVAGHFAGHQLGYGLLMYVLLSYIFVLKLLGKANLYGKIWYWALFLIGFYLFISTHSRLLTVAFFVTNFSAYIFISKNALKALAGVVVFAVFAFLGYYIILNTDVLPRIREMLVSDGVDSSTLYRFFIIAESLKGMSVLDYFIGIGMGGFNIFFTNITGEIEAAAHNDYLLWFVEGGAICLIVYLVFQFATIKEIISKAKKAMKFSYITYKYGMLSFALFLGVEVFGFLLNPHYFYQSENLVFFIIGFFAGNYSYYKNARQAENLSEV